MPIDSTDAIDRAILKKLQENGRLSNVQLAAEVGLSESACLRRVKLLEEAGIIDRYVMLISQAAIGKPDNVFVRVTLEGQQREKLGDFEAAVSKVAEVMECYLMAGDFDYLLRVIIRAVGSATFGATRNNTTAASTTPATMSASPRITSVFIPATLSEGIKRSP